MISHLPTLPRLLITASAPAATLAGLAALTIGYSPDVRAYVALLVLGTAASIAVTWRTPNLSVRGVLCAAGLLHLLALSGTPRFEDDYFRFLLDGWRTLTTGSPYGLPPAALFGDPSVPDALQPVLDGVNNPDAPTIYGPVLQAVFALCFAVFGTEERGLRAVFALCNLLLIALLLRSHPPRRVALYAFNPALIAELVLHAHPDGVMALLLVAGLGASRTPWLAGLCFGLAAGAKIVALAAWPALIRRGPLALAGATLGILLVYAPFLLQASGAGLDGAETFATQWRFNSFAFAPFSDLLGDGAARLAAALIGSALIIWAHARDTQFQAMSGHLVFGAVLLVSPVINAWYLAWILPFAVSTQQLWPWAASIALPLSYLTGLNLDSDRLAAYGVHPWARTLEILLLGAALAWDLRRARKATSASRDPLHHADEKAVAASAGGRELQTEAANANRSLGQ